jgi:uncharacterized protein
MGAGWGIWRGGMTNISKMDSDAVFLDTSGILAFLDRDDEFHGRAVVAWREMVEGGREAVTTDYVRLESWSLVQRRLGLRALEDFHSTLLPMCRVEPVGEEGFARAGGQVLLSQRRELSLVDVASFDCMRRLGLRRALAFDGHFREQGFRVPDEADWLG